MLFRENIELQQLEQTLRDGNYMDAIRVLCAILEQKKYSDVIDDLDAIQTSYHQMLYYAIRGVKDECRTKYLADIKIRLCEMMWNLNDADTVESNHFVPLMRRKHPCMQSIEETINLLYCAQQKKNLDSLLVATVGESTETGSRFELYARRSELFSAILIAPLLTLRDVNLIEELFEFDTDEALLVIPALLFSALNHPQREKILLIYHLVDSQSIAIRVRAIHAMCVLYACEEMALEVYGFKEQFSRRLQEDKSFQIEVDVVVHAIHQATFTDKLSELLQKEIFDQLNTITPQMEERFRQSKQKDLDDEERMEEMQDLFDETGFSKRLQKMTDRLRDGEDVYYTTFRHLKSYPFFNNPINWFIPYRADNPHIQKNLKDGDDGFVRILLKNHFMCDSDKYSLFFSMQHLPQEQMNMLLQQLNDEALQTKEDIQDNEIVDSKAIFKRQASNYVQMLYRFVHSNHYCLSSDGDKDSSIVHIFHVVGKVPLSNKMIHTLADESYAYGDVFMAQLLYEYLCGECPTATLYKKLGHCYEKNNNYDKALKNYLKADKLASGNRWTLRHISECYKMAENPDYDKELYYIERGLELSPEDVYLLTSKAWTLEVLLRYEEALSVWFKVIYLEETNEPAMKGIAVLSAYVGKKEQSLRYFDKLVEADESYNSLRAVFCYAYELTSREDAVAMMEKLPRPITQLNGVAELEMSRQITFPQQEILDYLNSF